MPDSTLTIVLTALPPTLMAMAALIVGIINSVKANRIHVLVNSNLSKVQSDLASATVKIGELQTLVAKMAKEPREPITG